MNHSRVRAAVVAALAALLATVVLAGPAAGAVASVSTGSQVAEEPTTHRFAVDDPRTGPLEAVELRYDSDADLDDAEVTVAVAVDADGHLGVVEVRVGVVLQFDGLQRSGPGSSTANR